MAEFRMPSLGADMDVGTVLEWLVAPGDVVHRGDVVAVVDTAKAAVEVEVFDDGVVRDILVPVGERVPVGTPLAELDPVGAQPRRAEAVPVPAQVAAPGPPPGPATTVPAPPPQGPPQGPLQGPPLVPAADVPVASPLVRHLAHQRGLDLHAVARADPDGAVTRADLERAAAGRRPRSSPYARRRAAELGVDLAAVPASRTGAPIRVADVERAAGERIAAAPPVALAVPPRSAVPAADRQQGLRQAIATLMARSKREVPHYYLTQTVDLARTTAWLHDHNRRLPADERVLPAAMLLKAVALAARKHPELNGFWRDALFEPAEDVNVGVAVSLRGGGLVAPAILAADTLRVDGVMAALRDLVRSSRTGRLRRRELTDGTITVTNLGDQSAESVHGVVFPPQVALVGFGSITDRPWAVDGLIGVRPLVTATLAADHRATDGHIGGRFLHTVQKLLQAPDELDQGAA